MAFEYEKHVPSRAEVVVGLAADAWRRWRDQYAFARFANNCPAEANQLARDLNVDRASLMRMAGQRQGALLDRRLHALGMDRADIRGTAPGVAQDLERCCTLCDAKARCARDLANRPHGEDWRSYCPNSQTLEALRKGQACCNTH